MGLGGFRGSLGVWRVFGSFGGFVIWFCFEVFLFVFFFSIQDQKWPLLSDLKT